MKAYQFYIESRAHRNQPLQTSVDFCGYFKKQIQQNSPVRPVHQIQDMFLYFPISVSLQSTASLPPINFYNCQDINRFQMDLVVQNNPCAANLDYLRVKKSNKLGISTLSQKLSILWRFKDLINIFQQFYSGLCLIIGNKSHVPMFS